MLEQDACQWWSAADLPAWPPEHAFIETAAVGSGGDASLGGEDERKGEDAVSGAPTAGDGSTTDTSQRPEQPLWWPCAPPAEHPALHHNHAPAAAGTRTAAPKLPYLSGDQARPATATFDQGPPSLPQPSESQADAAVEHAASSPGDTMQRGDRRPESSPARLAPADSRKDKTKWRCKQADALPKPLSKAVLRTYLQKGPPPELRKAFWLASVHPEVAACLRGVRLTTPSQAQRQAAVAAAKSVLHHSGVRNPRVNSTSVARVVVGSLKFSTQGQAQYVAPLMTAAAVLLTLVNEVQATAILTSLLRKAQAGVVAMVLDRNTFALLLHAFDDLALHRCPRVAAHATRCGTHTSLLVSDWFSSLYLGALPFDIVLRVVDAFVFQVRGCCCNATVETHGGGWRAHWCPHCRDSTAWFASIWECCSRIDSGCSRRGIRGSSRSLHTTWTLGAPKVHWCAVWAT